MKLVYSTNFCLTGLELWLNIEQYAYDTKIFRPVEWVGAVVKVHDTNTEPTPQEGGIVMGPATLNRLAVTKVSIYNTLL